VQGRHEVFGSFAPRQQPCQPRTIRVRQDLARLVLVTPVGVNAADDDVILEHCGRAATPAATPSVPTPVRQTMPPDPRTLDRVLDHLSDTGTLDEDVRLEANAFHSAGMIGGAKSAHNLRLGAGLGSVKHMDLQPTLHSEEGSQEANRSRTDYQHRSRLPRKSCSSARESKRTAFSRPRSMKLTDVRVSLGWRMTAAAS
jgi:hypothetical protein